MADEFIAPGGVEILPFETDGATGEMRLNPRIDGRSSDGRWRCNAHISNDGAGHFTFSDLTITPWKYDDVIEGGVTSDVVRKLPLGRWRMRVHGLMSDEQKWLATGSLGTTPEGRALAKEAARVTASYQLQRGPKRKPNSHFEQIANEYLDLQDDEIGRGIRKRIAENHDVQVKTVRDWLTRAVQLELLLPGTPGKAGRVAGPNLKRRRVLK